MVTQAAHCYALNRRSERPVRLQVVGVDQAAAQALHKGTGGTYANWLVAKAEEGLLQVFKEGEEARARLVYMTPDSPNTLEEVDPQATYVIGGISDNQNQMAGTTLRWCEENGVRHAQLPLERYKELNKRARVLNINHCFQILLNRAEGGEWAQVIEEALPTRASFQ